MAFMVEEVRYERVRVVCDRCNAKQRAGRQYGWSRSAKNAEACAVHAGWRAAPIPPYSDLMGHYHLCPRCWNEEADRA